MKAAIYNPYLDTLGGGERYTLAFAEVLVKKGWQVFIEWKGTPIKKKLEDRFGVDLSGIEFVRDVGRGDGYDLIFWVSDGSIPTLRARKNLLHFQVPFHKVGGNSLLNKMKLFRVDKIICNSNFTKGFIDKEYGVESVVVYPPIDVNQIKPKRKEDLILFVGRFSSLMQSKGQDTLIKAFKRFYDSGAGSGYRLVLAGGVEVGVGKYLKKLERMSKDYPIEIIKSPKFKDLGDLYGKSRIFWSASGFGVDEGKDPDKVEHFGITVIESMAAGAIPFAFNAGGHKEIIEDAKDGFLWSSVGELLRKTKKLIKSKGMFSQLSTKALIKSKNFSYEKFEKEILNLL